MRTIIPPEYFILIFSIPAIENRVHNLLAKIKI